MRKLWKSYFKGKIYLKLLLICSYIFSLLYYYSGLVFDTRNLLSGEIALYYSTNLLPILIYKPFMIMAGGSIDISVLIILFLSFIVFFKVFYACVKFIPEQSSRIYISDLMLFFPLFIVYLILPSKEQIYALSLSLIYALVLNRPSASFKPGKYLQTAFLSVICMCVRPASVLLMPFVILSLYTLQNPILFRTSDERFCISILKLTRKSLGFLVLVASMSIFLTFNLHNLLGSMKQIIFQSSYEIGNTSTQLLNSKILDSASEIPVLNYFGHIFQSSLLGAPFFSDATISIQTYIIAIAYIIANIFVVIPNILHVVQASILNRINIIIVAFVLLLTLTSWLLFSLGLTFNSGTGLRYYFIFFFTNWINFAIARRQGNSF